MEVATCINVNGTRFLLCVLMFSLLRVSHAAAAPAVYVLGASMVDVGNNNYLPRSVAKADYPHNGIDYPGRKPTGRFSNGMNFADFFGTLFRFYLLQDLIQTFFSLIFEEVYNQK